MLSLQDMHGFVHWTEREINARDRMISFFSEEIKTALLAENPGWRFMRCEGPQIIRRDMISDAYSDEDVWAQATYSEDGYSLVLRPETTPSSYRYLRHLLDSHGGFRPPLCVWQVGKSFRREQKQPLTHMRLCEFWQQEFQCLYTADTSNDYHAKILSPVAAMISLATGLAVRIVESDRIPSYSQVTMDIEANNGEKWMELCSISRRTDFGDIAINTRNGRIEKPSYVLEVAIGLDRCVRCWSMHGFGG